MICDYKIVDGIYVSTSNYELDIHNDFDFTKFEYSVVSRLVELHWVRSSGAWVKSNTPKALKIEFSEVLEFRFLPRDPDTPFSEDDCVNMIGYWTEDLGSVGVLQVDPGQPIEPGLLPAFHFMSGAILVVQSKTSKATVVE